MNSNLRIRALKRKDSAALYLAFKDQGWIKPEEQFLQYLMLQEKGLRDVLVAEYNKQIAGYLTIQWKSDYLLFRERGIPEIVDLNVLQKFQRNKIGSALMDEAEKRIAKISPYAGLGFGLTSDYGPAQIFYNKRNYMPDGNGLIKNNLAIKLGDVIEIDHGAVMYLIKEL